MRAFTCPSCSQIVFFENSVCVRCATPLGFDPANRDVVAVGGGCTPCANLDLAGCNWLVPIGADDPLCLCCRLTRMRPADDDPDGLAAFHDAEAAKRRLVFQLLSLGLPVEPYDEATGEGLAFDLLSARHGPVTTGHEDGVVTLDLSESDDAHRAQVRLDLHETYRTVLGHVRHEVGHYYWPLLVEHGGALDRFRALMGDERASYADAVERHYALGPPADWEDGHVSAYATMHPWEDWAETFAHVLHIVDTIETAAAFGVRIEDGPAGIDADPTDAVEVAVEPDAFAAVLDAWLPLTYALNAINRSMGHGDLYPFVLSPRVVAKLSFVHGLVIGAGTGAVMGASMGVGVGAGASGQWAPE